MLRRFPHTLRVALTAIVGTVIIVSGCGDSGRSLLSPSDPSPPSPAISTISDGGSFVIGFSGLNKGNAGLFAGKIANVPKVSQRAWGKFSPRKNGELKVRFDKSHYDNRGRGDDDDDDDDNGGGIHVKKAEFKVRKGSLSKDEFISMTVTSGSRLTDVQVAFTPAGIQFNPVAELEIELRGELTEEEMDALQVYHTSSDGEVTIALMKFEVDQKKKKVKLYIQVPGFSTYSAGGDDPPPEQF
jgi:hypothetical protein